MRIHIIYYVTVTAGLAFGLAACTPSVNLRAVNSHTPTNYGVAQTDTVNSATVNWKEMFSDPNLIALIDTALQNNQELNILLQEIEVTRNEVRARKGEYLPTLNGQVGAGVEKVGRYTRNGAVEATTDIRPEEEFPEPLGDYLLAANISWEVDIWNKLRNSKKSAMLKYLSSVEGRNFMVTRLVAEIANSYFELLALDNQLSNVERNILIQQDALEIVRLQKLSAKATELAVKKFEAEVLKNQSLRFDLLQEITEVENRINFLVGRFPQHVARSSDTFMNLEPDTLFTGIPSQLLANRPDIRAAELTIEAAKLDVKAAKAAFYPSFDINASIGYQAFKPEFLLTTPASLLYGVAGDLLVPVVNRNAIKAEFYSANAEQLKAMYEYEQRILEAYIEVVNLQAKISNLTQSYDLKKQQVNVLNESIDISATMFKSAKAEYMEVLMTQRDALEANMELIETKRDRFHAFVDMYQALGGGWSK